MPKQRPGLLSRNYPLLRKVEGRIQEYFVDKYGSLITFMFADMPLWNVKDKINAYQYIQNEAGSVLLKIDVQSKIELSDIERIKKNFIDLYNNIDIEIEIVESIPRTRSGKFKYLIQF